MAIPKPASTRHELTRADILPPARYARERRAFRAAVMALKRQRRVEIGPYAILQFENYDTMWCQIHEMLFIEKGGESQIADELAAFNPLIPKGGELVATLMLEIEDLVRREHALGRLGGIEAAVSLRFGGDTVDARATDDGIARSKSGGRTSSVHFLHFPFGARQIEKFRRAEVIAAIGHPNYSHLAVLPDPVRTTLAEDFD